MKLTIVAGARPNFMKIAPITHAIQKAQSEGIDISFRLVHTGQHYDKKMSGDFFEQLNIPEPDNNLEVGSGSQSEQTANIMVRFEKELLENPCDVVLVVGDVTSTMACTIVAKKLGIKVAHVEAGIRSFDMSMPEEVNRLVTDSITDYFFTTSEVANDNLKKAGVEEGIFFVGNTMIDTLNANLGKLERPEVLSENAIEDKEYLLLTMHRPANVDAEEKLATTLNEIARCSQGKKVVFPIHPRTRKVLEGLSLSLDNFVFCEALGYQQFIYLVKNAFGILTDSGGIQEESTVLGVPCLTLRDNTERPETCTVGTNELIGTNPANIAPAMELLMAGKWKNGGVPELWDGKSAERIVSKLIELHVPCEQPS